MLKKWVTWGLLLVLVCLLVGVGFWIYIINQKTELQDYIIDELNNHINATVKVEHVEITLLHSFPYLTASFSDVEIIPYHKNNSGRNESLMDVKRIYVDVDLIKALFKKQIEIRSFEITDGEVFLYKGVGGKVNWKIWKKPDLQGKKQTLSVRMIEGRRINIHFLDDSLHTELTGELDQVKLTENPVQQDLFRCRLSGDLMGLYAGKKTYVNSAQPFTVNSLVKMTGDTININKGKGSWRGTVFDLKGSYGYNGNKGLSLTINVEKGLPVQMATALHILPDTASENITESGGWDGTLILQGNLTPNAHLTGAIRFDSRNYSITFPDRGSTIEVIQVTGQYRFEKQGKKTSSRLVLDTYHIQDGVSEVQGNLTWENPGSKGKVVAEVEVEVAIHEIGELFNVDPYILESGHLAGSVEIEIPVNRKSDEISIEANEMHVQGRLSLQDITAGKCKSVLYATKLNGQLDFGNRIRFSGLTGRWLGFPVQVNGSIPDISGLLASQSGQHYLLEAVADRFVLDTLLSRIRQTDATEDSDQPASRWDLKCRFTAGKFSYGHFNAQDVNGTLSMDNNGVRIDPVTYYALDGYGTGQFEWMINQEKNPVLRAYTEVQQVDITKLFSAFNNFGQSVITSENIEGSLSGNVAFQTGFTSGGDPDMSSMLANASVAVTSGRLKHVEALYSLSKFIKLSELEDIHFSTLKNEIFIQNNTVIIPSMHIGSSALDLDLYGTQSFDNQFIYHIRLLLSDLLFRKASKADRNHNQYGIIEDDNSDRTSIYLVYKGDGDNSSIAYDKDRARQARKEALAREGRALKTILQQDLGLFKKDSLGTETTTEERKKFRLTFPDEVDTVKKDTGKGRSPHTYSVKWEDELPDSLKKK